MRDVRVGGSEVMPCPLCDAEHGKAHAEDCPIGGILNLIRKEAKR